MDQVFPSQASGQFGRRMRRERGPRVPVIVITGFLGAGKTTLLKRFLETPEGAGTAIVVNEFGEAGIDDALLRASADKTILMGNGCLCCISRTDLQDTLRRMVIEMLKTAERVSRGCSRSASSREVVHRGKLTRR